MKSILTFLILSFNLSFSFAQEATEWKRFEDKNTELVGFKDQNGEIKIPAKFLTFTPAHTFRSIISVLEKVGKDSSCAYYLLKNGKAIGFDSLYVWDNAFDCENENKIRFRVKKTDKVGFFGKDGKVAIPAIYNDAEPFFNGVAVAIKDAKKVCQDDATGQKYALENCEHWSWEGGNIVLINEKNESLLEFSDFGEPDLLNWYSLEVSDAKTENKNRATFKGLNGNYYSFIDFYAEFQNWFYGEFLRNVVIKGNGLENYCFVEIAVSDNFKNTVWKLFDKDRFLKNYKNKLLTRINLINTKSVKIDILNEELNSFTFESEHFANFYNDCGDHQKEKFPVFSVILTYEKSRKLKYQEELQFIRTNVGYKLILIALENKI